MSEIHILGVCISSWFFTESKVKDGNDKLVNLLSRELFLINNMTK